MTSSLYAHASIDDCSSEQPELTYAFHVEVLRRMLRIRLFDEKAASLRGRLQGFLHNSIGQEAAVVGACMALREDDFVTGNHRSHGHPIGKGAALGPLMAELFGKSDGICRGKGGSMHLASFSVGSLGESGIVGSLMPIAVGAGLSAKMRHTDQVCLCFFGDGAANIGPFHESLNLAAVWKLPVVFFCENNGYAATTAQSQTTSIANIADRSGAYSMPGVVADGQDVLAVYREVSIAVKRARDGLGPTLIEAKTYRFCDHSEMATERKVPYRSEAEIRQWRKRDPIELFIREVKQAETLSDQEIDAIRALVASEVDAALAFAEASPYPASHELLNDVFI